MHDDESAIARRRLADLGVRIQAKLDQLERHGVRNGQAWIAADDLRRRREYLSRSLEAWRASSPEAEAQATLAADLDALNTVFERWIAWVDDEGLHSPSGLPERR